MEPDQLPRLPRLLSGRKPEPIKPIVEGAMSEDRLRELVEARARPTGQRTAPPKNMSFDVIKDEAMDPARLSQMMQERARLAEPMPQPTRPPTTLPAATRDKAISNDEVQQRIQSHRNFQPTGHADLFEGQTEDAAPNFSVAGSRPRDH